MDNSFDYALLDRCLSDCKYFLGNGGRCERFLWGGNVKNHIKKMKELYNKVTVKPEWLTMEQINEFEKAML